MQYLLATVNKDTETLDNFDFTSHVISTTGCSDSGKASIYGPWRQRGKWRRSPRMTSRLSSRKMPSYSSPLGPLSSVWIEIHGEKKKSRTGLANRKEIVSCFLCRYHSGFHATASEDDLSRDEILLFPWGVIDENAPDACSPLTGFKSDNRYG